MKDEKQIKEFSDLLKKAKNKLNMNHREFSEWLGISRDTYMNWYNARRGPRPDSVRIELIEKIKKELNIQ